MTISTSAGRWLVKSASVLLLLSPAGLSSAASSSLLTLHPQRALQNKKSETGGQNFNQDPSHNTFVWVAAIAGTVAGVIGLVLIGLFIFRRCSNRRLDRAEIKPAQTDSGDHLGVFFEETGRTGEDFESRNGGEESSACDQSNVTSVFSYIDGNLFDDQSYSVATSDGLSFSAPSVRCDIA
jgi:hypothetical protein